EGDLFQVGIDQLDAEIADDPHQVEERPHLIHQGHVETGNVDGVFERFVIQVVDDFLRYVNGYIDLRLEGVGPQMRSYHHVFMSDQLFENVCRRRFLTPDIECSAEYFTGVQVVQHCLFFDDSTSGHVENDHAALHQAELT